MKVMDRKRRCDANLLIKEWQAWLQIIIFERDIQHNFDQTSPPKIPLFYRNIMFTK